MRLTQLSFAVLFALLPVSAQAGFEFVTPGDRQAAPVAADAKMPSVANDAVAAEPLPLSPVTTSMPAPVADTSFGGTDVIPLTPVVRDSDALLISDEPLTPQPTASMMKRAVPARPAPVMTPNDSSDVQGFGRQVPLVMALQQIVPPNYRYSFGPGVAAGQRINWNGGKPWKDVVADVARNNDLNVEIVSNVVALRRRDAMDIITAQSNVREEDDTVQGMQLKQVTPAPMAAPPAPLMPSPWASDVADSEPMPLLQKQEVKPAEPETSISDIQWSEEEPIAEIHEETTVTTVAEVKPAEPKKGFFDRLFDTKEEQKTTTKVEEKKIAVLNDNTVKSDAVEWEMEDKKSDLKSDLNKARLDAAKETPKDTTVEKEILVAKEETIVTKSVPVKKIEMPSPALTNAQEWQSEKGKTLRQTLTAWSADAGASIVWSSEYDYPLQTDVRIQGSYADAVRTMLAGFSRAKPRPLGRLYSNKSVGAKPVLVVETERLTR